MRHDRAEALRRESAEMTRFCRQLSDGEWQKESGAAGWRVQDVVAHVGSACHAIFTPASLKILGSKDIERTNDAFVDERRDWQPARVLAEFETWSGRLVTLTKVVSRTPLARAPMPLAELGRFPMDLVLGGALVFDMHTHLRHDMAPALGRPVPGTDELRMAATCEWMFAVLAKQLRAAGHPWLDRPVSIVLDGPGGGSWRVDPDGGVAPGPQAGSAAVVRAPAVSFPGWGTRRVPWREQPVTVSGDQEYGVRFLDAMNIV